MLLLLQEKTDYFFRDGLKLWYFQDEQSSERWWPKGCCTKYSRLFEITYIYKTHLWLRRKLIKKTTKNPKRTSEPWLMTYELTSVETQKPLLWTKIQDSVKTSMKCLDLRHRTQEHHARSCWFPLTALPVIYNLKSNLGWSSCFCSNNS